MIGVESEFEDLLSVVVDDVLCEYGSVPWRGTGGPASPSICSQKSLVPEASVESSVLQKIPEILRFLDKKRGAAAHV
jgi:hypothetical protein